MVGGRARTSRISGLRSDKIVEFLEATYDFDADEETWVSRVMGAARTVWKRGHAVHGATYDASDVTAFRVVTPYVDGLPAEGVDCVMKGLELITPAMVARTFRVRLVEMQEASSPEMDPMNERMRALGFPDNLILNGLAAGGRGIVIVLWSRECGEPPEAEMVVFRRMAHHLAAAVRCRRRLREVQAGRRRYIVARGTPREVRGFAMLSDRERQVVACAAIGQSTKETAYALGISDTTVRVLLSRAASKLGVKTRIGLLDHPEVRSLTLAGALPRGVNDGCSAR